MARRSKKRSAFKPSDSFWKAYDKVLQADKAYRGEHGPKELMVALFDFLGFKSSFDKLGHAKLRAIYDELLSVATREHGHMTLRGWEGLPVLGAFHPDYAYFSDTILLWHRWDLFFLPDFVRACAEMICEGLENQIPLRGAISVGMAEMENEKRIYFGFPLIEAAETERAQGWVGVSLGPSVARALSGRSIPADSVEGLMPYRSHVKPGFEDKVPGLVVDWPKIWRTRSKKDAVEILKALDVDARFSEYYRQTLDFVTYSKEHPDWIDQLARKARADGPAGAPENPPT